MLKPIFLILIFILLPSYTAYSPKDHQQEKIMYYNNKLSYKYPKSYKVVLVGGCFDLLHYGHIQFLAKSKKQGNYLIVA